VSNWSSIAVLSSTNSDLAQVRALAEQEKLPIRWCPGQQAMPALHKVREIHRVLEALAKDRHSLKRASDLMQMAVALLGEDRGNPWIRFVHRMLAAWQADSNDAETPVQEALKNPDIQIDGSMDGLVKFMGYFEMLYQKFPNYFLR
jgi:hypothetical protein